MRDWPFYLSCTLALATVEAGAQTPQAIEWRATSRLTSGNLQACAQAADVTVTQTGSTLSFLMAGANRVVRVGPLRLRHDGSAQINSEKIRLTMPAGAGPRPFQWHTLSWNCVYDVEPR